jgi:hypothetical protein
MRAVHDDRGWLFTVGVNDVGSVFMGHLVIVAQIVVASTSMTLMGIVP